MVEGAGNRVGRGGGSQRFSLKDDSSKISRLGDPENFLGLKPLQKAMSIGIGLIGKPLAVTTEEARTMVEATQAAGVPLMTAQTLRFTPVLRRLRERLAVIGSLEYMWLSMRVEPAPHHWLEDPKQAGGGVLIEIGIHLFDLIRYLTGHEAVDVWAEIVRLHTSRVEDLALARFLLASGVRCYVEVSRVSAGRSCRIEAVGENGQLLVDVNESRLTRIEGRKVAETESVADD